MALNILDIKPNKVSTDIGSYSLFLYGPPKSGKTTFATRIDKHLLLAFEEGYSALPNVMAADINSWGDFVLVLNQLKLDNRKAQAAKKKGEDYERQYGTIIIDVVDIAYDYCEQFICQQQGVEKIGDLGFGAGYALTRQEFDDKLREIVKMGYGLILISHAKTVGGDEEKGILPRAVPTLGRAPKEIVTRLVDNYAYISMDVTDEGTVHTMHMRATPEWEAGSRVRFMPEEIPLSYPNYEKAMKEAIQKEEELAEGVTTDETINRYKDTNVDKSFEEIVESITENVREFIENAEDKKSAQEQVVEVVEGVLGKGKTVKEATRDQLDLLRIVEVEVKGL